MKIILLEFDTEFCKTTYLVQDQDKDLSWYHFYFKGGGGAWETTNVL